METQADPIERVRSLDEDDLQEYVRSRLRGDPSYPPVVWSMGDAPELFLVNASRAIEDALFRERLARVVTKLLGGWRPDMEGVEYLMRLAYVAGEVGASGAVSVLRSLVANPEVPETDGNGRFLREALLRALLAFPGQEQDREFWKPHFDDPRTVDVAFLAAYRRNAEEAIEYLTPYLSKALSTLPEGALRLRLANYVLDYLKVKNLHRIAPAILALDPKDRNPVLEILRSLRIAPADWGRFESALKADDDPTRTADPSAAPAFQQPGSWRAADSIDVKSADYQKLLKAIRSVHAGDIWAGRRLIAQLVERLDQQARASSSPRSRAGFTLTKREQEVINLVARGLTKKEVARKLGISDKTVKTHLSKVVSRLL